jgi:predicted ATPase
MSDVVGSTALWEAHGDAMRSALEVHDRLVHGAVESAGGRVFKHTGDGMIAVFDDADDAARGALGATGALADGDWGVVGRLEIRVSVHAGSASERDGDFFGPPVNKVARINGVGHPGQVLVSDVARQLMGEPAGVDLGAHQLRDLSEAVRLWQLDDGDHPALRTLVKSRHNLPAMPTEFVGRQDEVDEVRNLVRTNRLVTITGVGGCGKTRAAVEVAAASADSFDGGVWFVDLTAERDGSAVGACVLGAMGLVQPLSEQYVDPVVALVEASQGSATLIVVDNCEHLIDDVAEFAEQVLAEAPMVTMLATSREALAVEGERAWRIPNLQAAAVELFLDRAAGVGVADLDEHLEIVEQICTALDDIPLAIELAASQAATLSLEELSTRLDNRFALLGGGRRSGRRRQRQQTLQTMMDWSYELLTDDEQMLLRELSVFAGSFAAAGVEAVATASPTPVLARLQSLVQQSLVMPLRDTGRYRLLETVRLYALDKLIALDAVADTRDRHLTWVHQSFNPAGLTQVQAVDIWANENRLWAEVENSIAAMEWAEETGDTEALFDVFVTYGSVWANDNRYTRIGLSWLDRVPIPPPTEPLNRTMWLGTSGLMHFNLGDLNSSIEIFLEGASYVDELRAADPQYFVTWSQVIFFRANMYSSLGDYDAALADAELLA